MFVIVFVSGIFVEKRIFCDDALLFGVEKKVENLCVFNRIGEMFFINIFLFHFSQRIVEKFRS